VRFRAAAPGTALPVGNVRGHGRPRRPEVLGFTPTVTSNAPEATVEGYFFDGMAAAIRRAGRGGDRTPSEVRPGFPIPPLLARGAGLRSI